MNLHLELHYPADPAAVAAMLADEGFHQQVAAATGARSSQAEVTRSEDGFSTRLHRVMPPVVPEFVRRFVGDSLDVVDTVTWSAPGADGSRTGQLEVVIAKAPVQLRGTTTLRPDGTGTVQLIDATLTASVPFVGARIEEASAGAVRAGVRQQEQVAVRWLGG